MLISKKNESMKRNVWCLLGLPFDSINLQDATDKVHQAAINKTPCFISTPNLNFLIASQKDSQFRGSVINSDLSVADGKPLIWMARLLNIPIPERVAGSDLIEELIKNKAGNKPLKVFFFGGEAGVGEIACKKLNAINSGLQCVGNLNPGFGSIEDMSSIEMINEINESDADFVIVSLGAKKGQAWIEKNRADLKAPIISHLGAVVNFIAGTVNRSPKIFQKMGLEWLWRIKEEPTLWKRYFFDGMSFINLFVFKMIPLVILTRVTYCFRKDKKVEITSSLDNDHTKMIFDGYCHDKNSSEININLDKLYEQTGEVEILIEKGSSIDASIIAQLQILKNKISISGRKITISTKSKFVTKIIRYSCCDYLLSH